MPDIVDPKATSCFDVLLWVDACLGETLAEDRVGQAQFLRKKGDTAQLVRGRRKEERKRLLTVPMPR